MNFSSPLHKVALEIVQLDNTVDDKGNGIDIYSPAGSGKYTLHYKAANKLAGAAGINWTESRVVKREVDPKSGRVTYIEHLVSYEVKKPNGSTKKGSATGFYSYDEDRAKNMPAKMLDTRRQFAGQQAESNAKVRAIFEALEQLPRHFTREELGKPFLVPSVVEDLADMIKDDPEAKRMIIAHSLGITDQVYGGKPPVQIAAKEPDQEAVAEVVKEEVDTKTGVIKQDAPAVITEEEYKRSWREAPVDQRVKEINRLIVAKGHTPTSTKKPEELNENNQIAYLWFLFQKPDNAEETLPWEG
jgi:hypothetical protein